MRKYICGICEEPIARKLFYPLENYLNYFGFARSYQLPLILTCNAHWYWHCSVCPYDILVMSQKMAVGGALVS